MSRRHLHRLRPLSPWAGYQRTQPMAPSFSMIRFLKAATLFSVMAPVLIFLIFSRSEEDYSVPMIMSKDVSKPSPLLDTDLIITHHLVEDKVLIQECPVARILTINSTTSSLDGFVNATLHSLSHASQDITGSNRPIEHLAKNYDTFKSVEHGFWAEFGVYTGGTLVMAYDNLGPQSEFQGVIAGFDSFEGLPENWVGGFTKGAFTSEYETVRGLVPESVELYKGWFQDTIKQFKTNHLDTQAALIHHDGDLFLSTTITLQLLDDRIVPGTHMIFDELVGYPGYEDHEILALWLWMNEHGVSLCAMGHGGPERIEEDISRWINPLKAYWHTSQSAWFQVLSRNAR